MRPFSVNSLAERWGCRPDTVYRMIRDGQLQAFRLGGKLIRIRWEEVERFECQSTALSGTGGDIPLPSPMVSEAAFASRLARMTEGLPKLAPVTSGTPGTGHSRNA